MNKFAALKQYQSVGIQAQVFEASPHRLIQMLMEGAMSSIAQARGALGRSQTALKGQAISKAVSIIGGLQAALDMEKGGEIAENLNRLYSYISSRLVEASAKNSVELLDEAGLLLSEIKTGWDAISR
ncbi:flagellar export chaperone FliS [Pseudomonas sp. PDM11]|uniref:flagellar export chaperone FliS n=1 Tax=Pseudomonas sp. PDM11 TaxID=2769309 RepID=UPI00177CD39F|nr:flagellar export chaperone FliS [Pseudomonas sp. PDM11]MBD9398218.1 flagellar export chaperone FliS [Pseudomonas sp. PDM11]